MPEDSKNVVPIERRESAILLIRGEKVMLDQDIAELCGVETRARVQAVKRNIDRFPSDFMFQFGDEEFSNLRSQFVRSSWGGRRTAPHEFTEQGVSMLSSVLRSPQAIRVSIEIVRAFVRLRKMRQSHAELSKKIDALETGYDRQFKVVFDAIRQLMQPDQPSKNHRIGFVRPKEDGSKGKGDQLESVNNSMDQARGQLGVCG